MAFFFFSSNLKPHPTKLTILFLNISFLFLLSLFVKSYLLHPSNPNPILSFTRSQISDIDDDACTELHNQPDYSSKCFYLKTHLQCNSKGYINYLQIYYCSLGQSPILGHSLFFLWLVVLFYLLGDTASSYFCHCLEGLSNFLGLSPTIAGVTLLSLGNGAPDFFASVVSFTGSRNGAVGLNSILGGAFFVSSVVLGVISTLISTKEISVDKFSFIRDVCFFLFSLLILLVIIYIGEISLWGSIFFLSIYFLYVCAVSAPHFINKREKMENGFAVSSDNDQLSMAESGSATTPLLGYVDDKKQKQKVGVTTEEDKKSEKAELYLFMRFLKVLELPLSLPRRLTIPLVSDEKWSKPCAVISVTLAPIILAALCTTQMENLDPKSNLVKYLYLSASLIGLILGLMVSFGTKSCSPPRNCLFLWLAGGFAMSVIWTYIVAEELVSLLYSLGNIIGVSPSILGLTVLAWGNSLGDLVANTAMAMNGGSNGVQIAMSACYAGPIFNIVMGLGVPLVLSSWSQYPKPYVIPKDTSLYETILFLIVGLLWALVLLPYKSMRLHKSLGAGLLTIYLCFLSIRVAMAIGVLKF